MDDSKFYSFQLIYQKFGNFGISCLYTNQTFVNKHPESGIQRISWWILISLSHTFHLIWTQIEILKF